MRRAGPAMRLERSGGNVLLCGARSEICVVKFAEWDLQWNLRRNLRRGQPWSLPRQQLRNLHNQGVESLLRGYREIPGRIGGFRVIRHDLAVMRGRVGFVVGVVAWCLGCRVRGCLRGRAG